MRLYNITSLIISVMIMTGCIVTKKNPDVIISWEAGSSFRLPDPKCGKGKVINSRDRSVVYEYKGNCLFGRLHGVWKVKTVSGETLEKGKYRLGEKHGKWVNTELGTISHYKSGDKIDKIRKDGTKTVYEKTDSDNTYDVHVIKNDTLLAEGQEKSGSLHGNWTFWSIKPFYHVEAKGIYKRGEKQGNWTYWKVNSNSNKVYVYKEENYEEGIFKIYGFDTLTNKTFLSIQEEYKNDLLFERSSFYPNGEINRKTTFDSTLILAEYRRIISREEFDSTGNLATQFFYEDSVLNSVPFEYFIKKRIDYYSDGKKRSETDYFLSKENGKYIEYYQDGTIKVEGKMASGKRQGEWIYRSEDGTITRRKIY